jgi:hypothetical protein
MLRYLVRYTELAQGHIEWYQEDQRGDASTAVGLSIDGLTRATVDEGKLQLLGLMAKRGASWPTSVLLSCFAPGSFMPSSLYQRFVDDSEWQVLAKAVELVQAVVESFDPLWVNFKAANAGSVALDQNRPHISVGWLTYIRNQALRETSIREAFDVVQLANGIIVVSEKKWPNTRDRISRVAESVRTVINPISEWDA